MNDDRLFSTNAALSRKGFYINLVILGLLVIGTNSLFETQIIPNVRTDEYLVVAKYMKYFFYLIYTLTFLSLIDRRSFDAWGSRESSKYTFTTGIIFLTVIINACANSNMQLPSFIQSSNIFLICISLIIIFILGIIKGKVSSPKITKRK